MGVNQKVKWTDVIPGTEHSRLEFIAKLIVVRDNPYADTALFKRAACSEIGKFGVLNAMQIASIVGVHVETARKHLARAGLDVPGTRGKIDARVLELVYFIAQCYAQGRRADKAIFEEVTKYIDSALLTRLAGVPHTTYVRAQKAYDAR